LPKPHTSSCTLKDWGPQPWKTHQVRSLRRPTNTSAEKERKKERKKDRKTEGKKERKVQMTYPRSR